MDNQCGPSNAAKDFSRLTLEDRSRFQDRIQGGNGSNSQSFRTSANIGSQANADFAGFQSGANGLPAAHLATHHHLPVLNAQAPAFVQQFGHPSPNAGGHQGAIAPRNFQPQNFPSHHFPGQNLPRAAVQSGAQPATYSAVGGLGAFPLSTAPGAFAPGLAPGPMPGFDTGHFHGPMAGPAPGLMANAMPGFVAGPAPGVNGAAVPQAGPLFFPRSGVGHRQFPTSDMFHYGQAQQATHRSQIDEMQSAHELREHREHFDREFQDAMDAWMAEHRDIATGSQAGSETSASLRGDTLSDATQDTWEKASEDSATRAQLAEKSQASRTADTTSIPTRASPAATAVSNEAPSTQSGRSELSVAAQSIIDSVADNDSPKFKNSSFLRMMRGLAQEEIVLEGKDFVRREGPADAGPREAGYGSHVTGSASGARQRGAGNTTATKDNSKGKGKGKAVTVEDAPEDNAWV